MIATAFSTLGRCRGEDRFTFVAEEFDSDAAPRPLKQ
jgi:hypothetical protein